MSKKTITVSIVVGAVLVSVFILTAPSSSPKSLQSGFVSSYQQTAGAVLLDVRTPAEFAEGHIEGAINIDFENPNFSAEIQKLDTAKSYFVYCRSGNRSGQAIPIMKRAGIASIQELKGGIVGNQSTLTLVQ